MIRRLAALVLGVMLALSGTAFAQDDTSDATVTVKREDVRTWVVPIEGKDWSIRTATPTYEGDTGLFRLSGAYTLQKGKASFSLFRDNYDRNPKGIDFSVHGLSFGYGATDRLEIFASVGVQNRTKVNYPDEAGYWSALPFAGDADPFSWQTGFGDIKVGVKYNLLDDYYRNDGVGLALKAVAKLPTADEAKGLGTGKAAFAGDLILSKHLNRAADIHASIGYEFGGSPSEFDLGSSFKWGVGINAPACKMFAIQAEVTGRSYSGADFDQKSTADLIVGPVVWIRPGFFIRPAFSYALSYDGAVGNSSAKKSGKQISIGYHPGTPCCEVYVPPPPPPPPPNRPPTVSLDCVKETVLAGETTPCRATAADPDGDPLTYAWSTSAGKVAGTGPDAVFDSASVPCDTTVTVTVQVSDGRSGTAQATDTVRVICPERPKPEPVTCTSGGFPRNMSRLNNVDKACLDDLAARMRQDPRSRIVIVGHADKSEPNAEVIGRRRAEAIKTYLVKERGLDEARVTARSAAATKPLDTGTSAMARAKNRRAEVTFVPEGATLPEDDD
jgi:outer membrane protein OmpA-like peptidoglycan-associated protein